jgi:type VI secretion system FHA domain protein
MVLVLRIENTQPEIPLALPREGMVEADQSLSIGRAADNDLVLEDPAGTISKRHCTIDRVDGHYVLVDHSRNGTFLNRDAAAMTREVPVPLKAGDFIQVSCFGLTVVAAAVPGTDEDGGTPPGEASFLGAVAPSSSYARPSQIDPGGLMSRREEPLIFEDGRFGESSSDSMDRQLEDDLLADPVPRRPIGDDPFRDHRPDAGEPRAYADRVAMPNMVFVQPKLSTEPIPDDWDLVAEMGLPASPSLSGSTASRALPAPSPEEPAAPPLPRPAPVEMMPAAEGGAAWERAAVAAFLDGCGLSAEDCGAADIVTVMRRAGQALRLSIANLHDLLDARTSTKEGFGVERTILGRSGNNPLKFVSDPHDALKALIVTTIPGFLVADEAVEEAFADIKAHQFSMVAAMQAALASVCQQLAPETIERTAGTPAAIERLMPQARQARWWRAYRTAFDDVIAGLDNNARQVFGRDFVWAYRHNGARDEAPIDERRDGNVG